MSKHVPEGGTASDMVHYLAKMRLQTAISEWKVNLGRSGKELRLANLKLYYQAFRIWLYPSFYEDGSYFGCVWRRAQANVLAHGYCAIQEVGTLAMPS